MLSLEHHLNGIVILLIGGKLVNVYSWCYRQVIVRHPCAVLIVLSLLCICCLVASLIVLGLPRFHDPKLASIS